MLLSLDSDDPMNSLPLVYEYDSLKGGWPLHWKITLEVSLGALLKELQSSLQGIANSVPLDSCECKEQLLKFSAFYDPPRPPYSPLFFSIFYHDHWYFGRRMHLPWHWPRLPPTWPHLLPFDCRWETAGVTSVLLWHSIHFTSAIYDGLETETWTLSLISGT